jgi:hypothetical protein
MNFSRDTFASQLGKTSGVAVSGSWDQWKQTSGNLNQELDYSYKGVNWRSWSPESSVMPTDLGMIVSCKIDFANGAGDDHIILIIGFLKVKNAAPTINFAEASIQFYNETSLNITSGAIKVDPSSSTPQDIGSLLFNALDSQIQAEKSKLGSGNTLTGRQSLSYIAQINVNAMKGTVSA